MSVAPNAGVVDLDTFLPPTGAADGVQGQVPKPLAGQAGYVLTGDGWASAGSVGLVGYQGTWNALTNTPTLTSSVGTQGYYYVVDVAGTTNLNGITDWQVGDWAIFNGSIWQKVDNTDSYDPANVAITGGTINNTTIGATTPSTGVFTTLGVTTSINASSGSANADLNVNAKGTGNVVITPQSTNAVGLVIAAPSGSASNSGRLFFDSTAGVSAIANIGGNQLSFRTAATIGSSTGSEQARIAHTASAVNYVQVTGAATGGSPTISAQGSDSSTGIVIQAKGGGGNYIKAAGGTYFSNLGSNSQFAALSNGSAVNYATVIGGSTGAGPVHSVVGSDTNIDINFNTKGTGKFYISDTQGGGSLASPVKIVLPAQYSTTAGTVNKIDLYGLNGNYGIGLNVVGSTASVDYVSAGTATTRHAFFTGNGVSTLQSVVSHTASAVNYLQTTGGATGSGVTLSAQGSDTNIDINLVPKGTGSTVYTGGVTINGTLTAQNEVLKGTGQNLILRSQQFSNAVYSSSSATRTDNQTTAPDGTSTGALIQATAVSYGGLVRQFNAPYLPNTTYTISVYAKAGTSNFVGLRASGGCVSSGDNYCYFNLSTGVATAITPISGTVVSVAMTNAGSGWYRCSVTYTTGATISNNLSDFSIVTSTGGTNPAYAGTETIFAWGFQVELGNTLNTYIPTTATVVYGTPTLSFSGVAGIGLQSDGSLYVQPAGTGALQAQATTSTATGGNARGANAVDWQTTRASASQVASGSAAFIGAGGNNTASGFNGTVVGGGANAASGTYTFVGNGYNNSAGIWGAAVVNGYQNIANGYYNFIGSGQGNSGTANAPVTTQSATMNGTTAVTLAASNASIKVGQAITGTYMNGFPPTYVTAISGTSLTLSQVASGSGVATLSFYTPHGVVVGGGNNQATGSYSFIGGGGDAGTAAYRNVASGDWSAIGGGTRHIASGLYSSITGGYNNSATGIYSVVAGGTGNLSSGYGAGILNGASQVSNGTLSAVLGGQFGTTRSINANIIFGSGCPISYSQGVTQAALVVLGKQTTDATPSVLTADPSAAGTTNQVILPNNSAYYFKGSVIANVTGAANGAAWDFTGAIMRGANAGSTVLIGTPAINRVAASSGATAWVIAITADTTNGGLAVTVTGAAATTIRWVAKLETTEVTY